MIALALAGQARSHEAPPDELAQEQMSVRELMRLDTALALSQAQEKLRATGNGHRLPDNPAGTAAGPRLVAIYGVGKKLAAELRVGPDTYVYLRGQPFPVGQRKADASTFVLRDMDGNCVSLERHSRELQLCLSVRPAHGG